MKKRQPKDQAWPPLDVAPLKTSKDGHGLGPGRFPTIKDALLAATARPSNEDYTRCSVCGGEKDAEGWCARYCENP